MRYRIEWNTGRRWEVVGVVIIRTDRGRPVHRDPVTLFGGPRPPVTVRLRAVPCPAGMRSIQRFQVLRSTDIRRVA